MTIQTVETIKTLLETSNAAVERALQVIYERQTSDEQVIGTTKHVNGMGFSGADAEILSSFACQVNRKVGQHNDYLGRPAKLGETLSPKQMILARKKIAKYARQLLEVSQAKAPETKAVEPAKALQIVAQKLLSFHLMVPKQGWQEMTEERAKAWYDRMLKLATFYRHEDCVLPWEQKAPGKFWINHAGELLQVLGVGEVPEPVRGDKETVDGGIAAAMTVKRLEKNWTVAEDKSFDAWRDSVETLDEPEEIEAEREMALGLDLERSMWEMEARGDREGTRRDELAKAQAREKMEKHSLKTYAADPEAREFRDIRSKISNWIAK